MNAHHDPIVTREMLAIITGKCADSIKRDMMAGKIPRFDARPDKKRMGWKLSTLASWNPRVGRQLDGLLKSPYLPAA
ncbi:MAG: hypothetical protein JNJ76_04045 [Candidatus Competibacter sp.]|nr:hypothetical protein [Candidatus Competibacter sp.]